MILRDGISVSFTDRIYYDIIVVRLFFSSVFFLGPSSTCGNKTCVCNLSLYAFNPRTDPS